MNDSTINITPIKVGDIFRMSWGYDQTNVNFFQVTRLSKGGVFIREIGSTSAGGEGFMCRNVVAVKDSFIQNSQWCTPKGQAYYGNVETFRKLSSDGRSFSIRGRYYASLWDGKPTYESWYA
jgi:hypothetical protein